MANQIKFKRSAVKGKVPLVTDLELGELAINTYDGKLFVRRNDGVSNYIREIGGNRGFEVKNQTGSTIAKGTAVGFVGTLESSGKLLVAPFIANGAQPSQYFIGLAEDDILNGGDGYVVDHGKLLNLDTSAWPSGTILYASSTQAGGLTSTQPTAPNNKITVAAVVNSSSTVGVLEVRVQVGSNLDNDELVEVSNPQDGDTLVYNSIAGRFENGPSAGTYTLPVATTTVLGGVKDGAGVTIAADGTISADVTSVAGRTGAVTLSASDISGLATVATSGSYNDLTDKPTGYTLQPATTTVLGGVKDGAGVTIAADGTLSADVTSVAGRTGAVVLTKSDVGLANVDNTTDSAKSVASAATLTTGRTIGMTGDVTWTSAAFNGSANVTGTATLANSGVTAGTYPKVAVDAKGRVTAGSSLVAADIPNLDASKITSGTFAAASIPTGISITGNAATATALQTARTINGVSFDGTANITVADSTKIPATEKGTANGVATLDGTGKVPSTQLPSYVDDVLEYTNLASFPATGETGKIYVALDTNKTYRWSGSAYVYITSGAVDSVAGKTGVVTLVKADVGLANVDNTADSAKSVASAAKLTTARTISLTGAVTGSVSFDGSQNVSIATTHTSDPVITLTGDVTGSGTMTDLGSVSITATVADDSHNHIISNVDGLQAALDNKFDKSGGSISGSVSANSFSINNISVINSDHSINDFIFDMRYSPGERITMTNYQPNAIWNALKRGYTASWNSLAGVTNPDVIWVPDTGDRYAIIDLATCVDPLVISLNGTLPITTDVGAIRIFLQWHGSAAFSNVSFEVQGNDNIWYPVPAEYSTGSGMVFSEKLNTYAVYPTKTPWKGIRAVLANKVATTGNRYLYGIGLYAPRAEYHSYLLNKGGDTMLGNLTVGAGSDITLQAGAAGDIGDIVFANASGVEQHRLWDAGQDSLHYRRTASGTGYKLLHVGNYNQVAPTLTGGGASGTWGISITGSAATLTTGRTIGMTGDVTWTSAAFNGSGNVTGTATLANSGVIAGTYTKVTTDAKGRVTTGSSLVAADIPNLDASKITSGTIDAARLPVMTASSVSTANWTFGQDTDGSLVFKHNGLAKARLGTDGTFLAINIDSDPTP